MENLKSGNDFKKFTRDNDFDFLDFGCSRGGSIAWSKKTLGGTHGLGIDIAAKKVAEAQEAGHAAVLFDIKDIPPEPLVRFTVMSHFLEHVPSPEDVKTFIRRACQVSTDFVFIKQPYFDADGYLLQNGLKLYWSDWRGHPNPMTTLTFYRLLTQLQAEGVVHRFSIHGKNPITSSDSHCIQSAGAPTDQHHFDAARHPAKPAGIEFTMPVFQETVVQITMPGMDHASPFAKFPTDSVIVDEHGNFSRRANAQPHSPPSDKNMKRGFFSRFQR